jgi:hypothetical protein
MKKLILFLSVIASIFLSKPVFAQCETVYAEAFPRNPQTGPHNYFGVRVSIAAVFGQDITVYGYVYDEGSPDTNHPYELTITSGNTSAETGDGYYQTGPANTATASVSAASPCPPVPGPGDKYVKRRVAVIDFYAISTSHYRSEIDFKNYGITGLPSIAPIE